MASMDMDGDEKDADSTLSLLTDKLSEFSFDTNSPISSSSSIPTFRQATKKISLSSTRSASNYQGKELSNVSSTHPSSRNSRIVSDTPFNSRDHHSFVSRIPIRSPAIRSVSKGTIPDPTETLRKSPSVSLIPIPQPLSIKVSKKRVSEPSPLNSTRSSSNPKRVVSKNLHERLISESYDNVMSSPAHSASSKPKVETYRHSSTSTASRIPRMSHSSSLHSINSAAPSYLQPTSASLRKSSHFEDKENKRLDSINVLDTPKQRIRSHGARPSQIEPQREKSYISNRSSMDWSRHQRTPSNPNSNLNSSSTAYRGLEKSTSINQGLKKSSSITQDLKLSSMKSSPSFGKGTKTLASVAESTSSSYSSLRSFSGNTAFNDNSTAQSPSLAVKKIRNRPTSLIVEPTSSTITQTHRIPTRTRRDTHSQRITSKHKPTRNVSSTTTNGTIPTSTHVNEQQTNFRVSSLETFPVMFAQPKKLRSITQPHSNNYNFMDIDDNPSQNEKINLLATHKGILKTLESHPSTSKLMRTYSLLMRQDVHTTAPCKPQDLAMKYSVMYEKLNSYEREEVLRKPEVYFTGTSKLCKINVDINNFQYNFGFDNEYKNYNPILGDHINYRYQIMSVLGKGAFGIVLACNDHKTGAIAAVKIIKNEMVWSLQAVTEVKMLKQLRDAHCENTIQYIEHFHFRSHMCIVTDLMSVNLYQLIEATNFQGLPLNIIQDFSRDIARGLKSIHDTGMIHCDLKPENIMLQPTPDFSKIHLKIIDFGSSCRKNEISFSYLQSRFYRSPEVAMGARYHTAIDIWSFAALIVEAYTGTPLFPAEDEYQLLASFVELFGTPQRSTITKLRDELLVEGPIYNIQDKKSPNEQQINTSTLLWKAFTDDGSIDLTYLRKKAPQLSFRPFVKNIGRHIFTTKSKNGGQVNPGDALLSEFIDMLNGCFNWDGEKRLTAQGILDSDFLLN